MLAKLCHLQPRLGRHDIAEGRPLAADALHLYDVAAAVSRHCEPVSRDEVGQARLMGGARPSGPLLASPLADRRL